MRISDWSSDVCSSDLTQALAQDLGMTADDLLARRKGQAFSAEEAYAARAILAKSGNELVTMAKRLRSVGEDPGSEEIGRAPCRGRVCTYGWISVGADTLTKKKSTTSYDSTTLE